MSQMSQITTLSEFQLRDPEFKPTITTIYRDRPVAGDIEPEFDSYDDFMDSMGNQSLVPQML